MQTQQFLFQITQQYVAPILKIITPYWALVTYEVVDNKVVVLEATVPYLMLTYLNNYKFTNDIYLAAENNHASNQAAEAEHKAELLKETPYSEVFVKIFEQFKMA